MKRTRTRRLWTCCLQGVGVRLVSKVVVLGNIFKLNRWRKKRENEQPQWWLLITFSWHLRMQTYFQSWCVETMSVVERERRVVNGKVHSILDVILVDWRILLKDENEPSMKVFQEMMIRSCVEVAVREMKRPDRILRISAEHKTSVRITDDISLLNWIPHFAMQCLNKMRTGRRWRKPVVQFGENFWFHKIREEVINSFVKRIIQGIFVGHHDRTRAIPYIAKSGIVRGKSRTRQMLGNRRTGKSYAQGCIWWLQKQNWQ